MDLLAAEIARKRKAKAELAAVGGVRKYAKKGQKEEAARRALLAEKDADRGPGPGAVAGGEVEHLGEDALVVDPASANPAADKTRPKPTPDAREPEDDVSALDSAETIRRLRLLGEPATLFAEDDKARRARLRVAQASFAIEDEHAGGQQANERREVLEALAREERARREKEAARLGDVSARGANAASDDVPGAGVGPGSVEISETKTENANGSELADAFEDAARRVAAARDAETSHPADQIVRFLKSLLEEWQREVDANVARDEHWGRTESGRQSAANVRLCAQHLKPLFRKCAKRRLPEDLERALFLVVKRMRARDYRAAADAYVGVAIGNAAWPIGVTMVGIHERSARTKINAQTQAHAMHDEETRKFLQSVKRLMTFAQRRFPNDAQSQSGLQLRRERVGQRFVARSHAFHGRRIWRGRARKRGGHPRHRPGVGVAGSERSDRAPIRRRVGRDRGGLGRRRGLDAPRRGRGRVVQQGVGRAHVALGAQDGVRRAREEVEDGRRVF